MTLTYGDIRAQITGARANQEAASVRIYLAKKSIMRLKPTKRDTAIRCWSGKLWVTASDDPADYFLSAGDRFAMPRSGRVVIEAVEDAVVGISQ